MHLKYQVANTSKHISKGKPLQYWVKTFIDNPERHWRQTNKRNLICIWEKMMNKRKKLKCIRSKNQVRKSTDEKSEPNILWKKRNKHCTSAQIQAFHHSFKGKKPQTNTSNLICTLGKCFQLVSWNFEEAAWYPCHGNKQKQCYI